MEDKKFYQERIVDPCIRMYETILWERKTSAEEMERLAAEEKNWLRDERNFAIPRISIIVTTRCSLRCEGCSQLIPCYEKPYDISMEEIIT